MAAYYHIGTVFYKMNIEISDFLKRELIPKIIEYTDSIISLVTSNNELKQKLQQLAENLRSDPENTLYDIIFEVDSLIQSVDA